MFAGIGLSDIIIVACCIFVFVTVAAVTADKSRQHSRAGRLPAARPPIAEMAQELGIPAYRLRTAFEEVGPPSRSPQQPPSEQQVFEHSRRLAVALDVPVDRLRTVLAAHNPPTSSR